jgi:hypothetical protein
MGLYSPEVEMRLLNTVLFFTALALCVVSPR